MNGSRHPGTTTPIPPMPGFVKSALTSRSLIEAYDARPKFQRDEYMVWIHAAKLNDGKRKRLTQMLDELAAGNAFLGKPWAPPEPAAK